MTVTSLVPRINDPRLPARFWRKVHPQLDGCWLWLCPVTPQGYGLITLMKPKKRPYGAHRVAYIALVGPIPDGLVIDHLCRERSCVNPSHMEVVTQRENVLRGVPYRPPLAAVCRHGHARDLDWQRTRGACRECKRIASAVKKKRLRSTPEGLEYDRRKNRESMRRAAARKRALQAMGKPAGEVPNPLSGQGQHPLFEPAERPAGTESAPAS